MRIWLAASRYGPHLGGIETVTAELARALGGRGHDVTVLTNRHPSDLLPTERLDGVLVHRLRFDSPSRRPSHVLRFGRSWLSVAAALEALPRPDVVNVHGASSQCLHVARFCARRGVPLVLTTHGEVEGDADDVYGRSRFLRAALRYTAGRAHAVTGPSRSAVQQLSAVAPRALDMARVVPNGIDVAQWRAVPPARPTGVVMAWGRLDPHKGFDRLVDAWPEVRRQHPGALLHLAGEGPQEPHLRRTASEGVHFLGRLDHAQLRAALADAQLAAVPSRREAFGRSALEALAAGRRVVHSGAGGLPEVVGDHGWAVDHDDRTSLAAGLLSALAEPVRPVPPSAVDAYDWSTVTRAYEATYALGG